MSFNDKWNFDLGWCSTNANIPCAFHSENVLYSEENKIVEIKHLHHPEGIYGWQRTDDGIMHNFIKYYSAGMMMSKEKVLYGEFECTMLLPDFRGSWPAFWLYSQSSMFGYNEIDWFEQFRKDRCLSKYRLQSGLIHKFVGVETHLSKTKYFCHKFNHHFILYIRGYWFKNVIKWYLNDKLVLEEYNPAIIPHQPLHIIVGGGMGNWKPKLNADEEDNAVWILSLKHNDKDLLDEAVTGL